ncbi:MAG: hypothetical protein HY287_04230 [Planctomycetes bacterium]|nr:hypothetical protein [Planctomycetota bacterium]MBI3833521.1 hypothetical protein [Planctomycetota bacterium]
MSKLIQTFNELLSHLDQQIQKPQNKDAIADILGAPPLGTKVQSLHDLDVMQQFRRELSDGTIQMDTLHQILGLVSSIMKAVI